MVEYIAENPFNPWNPLSETSASTRSIRVIRSRTAVGRAYPSVGICPPMRSEGAEAHAGGGGEGGEEGGEGCDDDFCDELPDVLFLHVIGEF